MPWLVDVARLEHWRNALLDAPDVASLSSSALASIPIDRWPGLRFQLGANARLLRGRYDVHALWERARAAGEPADGATAAEQAGAPEGGPEGEFFVLVWRRDFAVVHRSLSRAEGRALAALEGGGPFVDISAHAERDEHGHADPGQVVRWLETWLAAGVIAAVIDED
jgi:hypothetical protein